ncbi:MAG TPA: hypothetical protein VN661_09755 [Candidatus Acidoferrales bacterium]|nr:hypothetical protein [Candidatus Acidoferrales bacterium]
MNGAASQRMDVHEALDDLNRRTLSAMERVLDRMIYLASLRDYNTGLYHHAGLASQFTSEVACEAIAACHRDVFQRLLCLPLSELVAQLDGYIKSTFCEAGIFFSTWRKLEPYRVAIPMNADPVAAELLFSNFKVALAILEARQKSCPVTAPAAWPRP